MTIKSANLSNNYVSNAIVLLYTNFNTVFLISKYYEISNVILNNVNLF